MNIKRLAILRRLAIPFVALLLLFAFINFLEPKWFRFIRTTCTDFLVEIAFGETEASDAVVIEVDPASYKELDHWPPSRIILADVQRKLLDAGAKKIGWCIMFTGHDPTSPANVEKFLKERFPDKQVSFAKDFPDYDEAFIALLKQDNKSVIGLYTDQAGDTLSQNYQGLPAGHITVRKGRDGKVRYMPLYDQNEPALALQLAEMTGKEQSKYNRIYFRHWNVESIPFIDVYRGTFDPEKVKGKNVFIGHGKVPTVFPWGEHLPVYASVYLFEELINKPLRVQAAWINALAGFIAGFAFLLIVFRCRPRTQWLAALALSVCSVLAAYALLTQLHLVTDATPAILSFILCAVALSCQYSLTQTKKVARLKRYIAPEIVSLPDERWAKAMEGEERDITVLFSDLRGFTRLCGKLTPKQIQTFLNELFTPMSKIVRKHCGIVDKYVGDELMATWNTPYDVKNHPEKALQAAFEMIAKLPEIEKSLPGHIGAKNLRCGIGINSGVAFVGDMGAENACAYTCLGSTVNLASRVEHLCSEYNEELLVTEKFTERFSNESPYRFLLVDVVPVKGVDRPQFIYRPVRLTNDAAQKEAVDAWLTMEKEYRAENIKEAIKAGESAVATGYFNLSEPAFLNNLKSSPSKYLDYLRLCLDITATG